MWVFSVLECLCKTSDLREGLPLRHSYALSRRAAQAPEFPSLLQASAWYIQPDTPSRRSYLPWWKFMACILDSLSMWFPGLEIFTLPLPTPHSFVQRAFPSCSLVTFTVFRGLHYLLLRHSEGFPLNISALFCFFF